MTVTVTPRFGLTRWSDDDDEQNRAQFDLSFGQLELLSAKILTGLAADLPVAGEFGRFYLAADLAAIDPDRLRFDTGADWISLASIAGTADLPRGLAGLPVRSTTSDSPSTSTNVYDNVLGAVEFTAVAGRRYTIRAIGNHILGATGNEGARARLRLSTGAVDPTIASESIASTVGNVTAAGDDGKIPVPLERTLTCPDDVSAGVHRVGVTLDRFTGSGTVTLSVSAGGIRQLKVADEGAV